MSAKGIKMTLASNIDSRKRRLDISELSKTITDAIMVTRAFGERFLWADAVCIIQGTIDWFDEAPKMGDYYKNAICTIAATSAMDSSEGFLNPRPAQSLPVRECSFPAIFRPGYNQHSQEYKVQLVFQPQVPHKDDIIRSSPLYERGWTCQERLLSTRIMYWTEHALFWECLESEGSEFDHHGRVRQHRGQSFSVMALKNMKIYLRLPKKRALGSEWCKLVQSYSRLALTVEDDRLVALSGLANEIGKTFGDKCLYGHWRSRLRQSLRWSRSPGRRKGSCSEDTAVRPVPSWSWPSVRDAVDISDSDIRDDGSVFAWLMEVVDVSGELDHLKVTTEIGSTCKLHILGMVEPLRYDSWRETEYDTSTILFSFKEHPELGDIGIMFDDFSWDFPVSGTLLCLLVSRSICEPPYWERWSDTVPFIVVEKLSEPDTYKRIGYGGMSVSGENKRIRALPSLLNTPSLKRSLFLV
ncbi:heterokaryon incompatibility protein [Colletotrichum truncatum]|uniref:Heterokaryon incompatibility protein n=1 Tax=Colletotrichum truncatum TaxID=5467 RepID=A0ACC3YQG9_COLTU